jgi:hypothetical protein
MALKDVKYKQCELSNGTRRQVAWIPEKFAQTGKVLRLHDEDGWRVKSVGSVTLTGDIVSERSQDYKRTRQASDA